MLDQLNKVSILAQQRQGGQYGGAIGAGESPSALAVQYRQPTLTENLQSIIEYHDKQAAQAREALEKLKAVPGIEEFLNAVQGLR